MKITLKIIFGSLTCFIIAGYLSQILWAQPAPIPYHQEPYHLHSGEHKNIESAIKLVDSKVVRAPGSPWMQLHFGDYNLGKRSYITITSLKDGIHERLNHNSMTKCRKSSVYFNGDAVKVELLVAPGEKNIFFSLVEISVGEWVGAPESICGQDDRVSSTDPRVGRIIPVGCTGWIVSNGAHLTAGHCQGSSMLWLQFNVPPSLPNGTIQHPPAEDQYAITNIVGIDDGLGNDWAVFKCQPNLQTDLLPVQAQEAFYRMTRDQSPSNVRVTGYGVDDDPPGTTGGNNSDSQTLQTDTGSFLGEVVQGSSDIYIEYTVDTEGGNSGSPVIIPDSLITVGIHTNGGCNPPYQGNYGTSFENDSLENIIQIFPTFPEANIIYVDKDHPVVSEDGTIFRPYDTVAEAFNEASPGDVVSIVKGSYNEQMRISKAMTFSAPVGTVTIGK